MLSLVRLSVRPYVTRVDQSKAVEVTIKKFSLYGSLPAPVSLIVFCGVKFRQKILMGSPIWASNKRGWGKQAIL